jgi:NADH:ubiquinone oxidoreductase subunit 5 (subunit L)/multisubunit Na+/H+ antiporter MnhA subunit
MPATGSAFLVGALSASGLPLLNGFIGEWLIALGFFYAIRSQAVAGWLLAFAAPALALAGAMAIASFLRIVGVAFLGSPRSAEAASAHESPRLMLLPLALLSAVCLSVGLLPAILARPLAAVTAAWSGAPAAGLLPYLRLLYPAFAIAASLIAAAAAMLALLSRRQPRAAVTWDCGYAEPTARMQYTASSTGEWFWRRLPMDRRHPGGMAVSPASSRPAGLFPDTAAFSTETADPFSSRWYEPFAATWTARFERLRWLQQGRLTIYLVYILVTTIIGVAWAALRGYWR